MDFLLFLGSLDKEILELVYKANATADNSIINNISNIVFLLILVNLSSKIPFYKNEDYPKE